MDVFTETIGHYNVFRKNPAKVVADDVEMMAEKTSVFDLNEVIPSLRKAVKSILRSRHLDSINVGSVWLIWDPQVWDDLQFTRRVQLCPSAKKLGYNLPFHPSRHLLAQGLEHRKSHTRHLMMSTHLPQGYAKKQGYKSPKTARLEDIQAMRAVQKLDMVTERWLKSQPQFEFHHLSGDFNSRAHNREEHWYPANVLRDIWVPDPIDGIDWMLHSRASAKHGLDIVRRWNYHGKEWDSDHPAGFKRVQFPAARR